jgi:hypothetical protein
VEGFLPIFFLGVVLKIPVALLLYLVWWSFRQQPEPEEAPGGGAGDHEFRRWGRQPRNPRGPRRGPHAPDARPIPDCPPGGRTHVAKPTTPVRAGGHGRGVAEHG